MTFISISDNHLPLSVQEADTFPMFKSPLQTFLLDEAYS